MIYICIYLYYYYLNDVLDALVHLPVVVFQPVPYICLFCRYVADMTTVSHFGRITGEGKYHKKYGRGKIQTYGPDGCTCVLEITCFLQNDISQSLVGSGNCGGGGSRNVWGVCRTLFGTGFWESAGSARVRDPQPWHFEFSLRLRENKS